MQSLQKQFHDFIAANHLVNKGDKVLLAVSGGLDSMVMANLFLSAEIDFALAHCNYGLRGEESDGDEAFVLDWADKNKINCHVKAFEITGSTQLEARKARYEWFDELTAEHGFDKIATAHHLNDSLETSLINLTRGTGIKGIAGIATIRERLIRPLLFADKKQLHDYAMDNELSWREDASNHKTDYDRNYLRHNVVPELLKLNPSLLKTFRLTQERLDYASQIVSRKVEQIRSQFLKEEKNGYRLSLDWISNDFDELILAEILASFGANYSTAKEVFSARDKSGKSFPVGEWLITTDRNIIYLDRGSTESSTDMWIDSEGSYELQYGQLKIESCFKDDVSFDSLQVAYFDADVLEFPLRIRSWNEGDKFQPLGMHGEKKVSDFLIDEKVPLSEKKNVLVLEADNTIAWVVGLRISEKFKLFEKTKSVIKITFVET